MTEPATRKDITVARSWPAAGALVKLEKRSLDGFELLGDPVIGKPRGARWAHTHFLHQLAAV